MKWISVKEKLPEDSQLICTYTISNQTLYVTLVIEIYRKEFDVCFDEKNFRYGSIGWTYWIPVEDLNFPEVKLVEVEPEKWKIS